MTPAKPMSVADFIQWLQTQPQHLPVAYRCCSEYVLLETADITISEACMPRDDGWLQRPRPDMPTQPYLMLPGN